MKKLIIIEGNDNSGKDTLIERLKSHYNDKTIEVFHCEAPKSEDPVEAEIEQWDFFLDLLDNIFKSESEIIILNRAWYGEYVYGTLYRGRTKDSVLRDNLNLEILLNKGKQDHKIDSEYYIQLIADSEVLKNNEDGLSISQGKLDKIENEKQLFIEMFNHSKINKVLVEVTENGNYRSKDSIFNQVINFIENDK